MGLEALSVLDSLLMGLLLLLVLVCGVTDVLYHKLWNVVTVPAMLLGLLLNLAAVAVDRQLGLQYFVSSLLGLGVGFGVFLLIFFLGGGGMGGGDVKYIAAIGAIDPLHFGADFILQVILYSILANGALAIVMMAAKGKLVRSFRNVFRTIFTFVTPGVKHVPLKPEDSERMPFGFGISLGVLWALGLYVLGILPRGILFG